MDLSIIIVSWNTKKLIVRCLESIFKFTKGISFEIIVVDNASSDNTEQIIKKFPEVELIQNRKNLGFGTANNQGIKIAKGRYLCFLNPDTFLVENSFEKLVKYLDTKPKVGVLGPKLLNPDKSSQQSVGFFPHLPQVFWWMTFIDDLPFGEKLKPYHVDHDRFYQKEQQVDWVTGAVMVVRREVFDKVNGFDENVFLYGEEWELCFRIKKQGFEVLYTPVTKIVHLGRASMQSANIGAITGEYKAILYFYQKHKTKLEKFFVLILLKMGALLRILVFGLILRRKELLKTYWSAFQNPDKLTLAFGES